MKKYVLLAPILIAVASTLWAQPVQWIDWKKTLTIDCQTVHYAQADLPPNGPTNAGAEVRVSAACGSQYDDGDNEYVSCDVTGQGGSFCWVAVYEDSCRSGWGNSRSKTCTGLNLRTAWMHLANHWNPNFPGIYFSNAIGTVHAWAPQPQGPGQE